MAIVKGQRLTVIGYIIF